MPHIWGSISPRAALAAMAASTALPPFFNMPRPTSVARGWLVATMPLPAMTVERPLFMFILSVKSIFATEITGYTEKKTIQLSLASVLSVSSVARQFQDIQKIILWVSRIRLMN